MRRVLFWLAWLPLAAFAQINTDHMIRMGRNALFYDEYVLSIRYFNQAIEAKPYLSEPYYYRAVAKFYLEDYWGAEADCSASIARNPFIDEVYQLRGLCRIKTERYAEAVEDYTHALEDNPDDVSMWYNRVLCRIELKDYDQADADLDEMIRRWPKQSKNYGLKAQVAFERKDSVAGEQWIDRLLALDPRDASGWGVKGVLALQREAYLEADSCLTEALTLDPTNVANYLNRALARYSLNRFSGVLADYDKAIELAPNSFVAHYNRGLLRAQVGDDNRAISDFDFVIEREPDNILAIYNRALLCEKTGDFRGAIRDYSRILEDYPNFAYGLSARARCRKAVGDRRGAEADERRLLVMQLDGSDPTRRKRPVKKVRKRSEHNLEDYSSLVVEDNDTLRVYDDEYRGRIQNKRVDDDYLPPFAMTLNFRPDDVKALGAYLPVVDRLNSRRLIGERLALITTETTVDEPRMQTYFSELEKLTKQVEASSAPPADLLMVRSVIYYSVRDFTDALADVDRVLTTDSTRIDALLQRASIRFRELEAAAGPAEAQPDFTPVLADLDAALRLSPASALLYYNRACVWARTKNYQLALSDLNRALQLDTSFAEAYYNRGLIFWHMGNKDKAYSDWSKAGELGLFPAYSLLKQYRE